jgi:hypothetical protein
MRELAGEPVAWRGLAAAITLARCLNDELASPRD